MFGEVNLYSVYVKNVDSKYRVGLPVDSKAEAGEIVIILSSEHGEFFEIYSLDKFEKMLDSIDQEEQKKLLFSVVVKSLVDKQRRILIRNIFPENIPTDKVVLVGSKDHYILFPNKEQYNSYTKKLK